MEPVLSARADPAPRAVPIPASSAGAQIAGFSNLVAGPFDAVAIGAALRRDAVGRAGALVEFTGLVRGDPGPDDTPVTHLEFEVFHEMAATELEAIRLEAAQRFALCGITLVHRTDSVRLGDAIVLVCAVAAHRRNAFEGATWAMDQIKARVPLWKRERRANGDTRWVPAADCACIDAAPAHPMGN